MMGAIHIKIIDGNGRRLLEMTQYHGRTRQEMIEFLDKIEQLVNNLVPTKRSTRVSRD